MPQDARHPTEPASQIIIRNGESYLQKDERELNLLFFDVPPLINPVNPPTVTMKVFRNAPDPERGILASGFVFEQTFEMRENSISMELSAAMTTRMYHEALPETRLWVEFHTSLGGDSNLWLEILS